MTVVQSLDERAEFQFGVYPGQGVQVNITSAQIVDGNVDRHIGLYCREKF